MLTRLQSIPCLVSTILGLLKMFEIYIKMAIWTLTQYFNHANMCVVWPTGYLLLNNPRIYINICRGIEKAAVCQKHKSTKEVYRFYSFSIQFIKIGHPQFVIMFEKFRNLGIIVCDLKLSSITRRDFLRFSHITLFLNISLM